VETCPNLYLLIAQSKMPAHFFPPMGLSSILHISNLKHSTKEESSTYTHLAAAIYS
jgi:hypothetical protein